MASTLIYLNYLYFAFKYCNKLIYFLYINHSKYVGLFLNLNDIILANFLFLFLNY